MRVWMERALSPPSNLCAANVTVARLMQVHQTSSRSAAMLMVIPFLITLTALFFFLACVYVSSRKSLNSVVCGALYTQFLTLTIAVLPAL
jgi:membrane protein CcdC involved in cytochrome C biogenesis